jgi:hypothetical protein
LHPFAPKAFCTDVESLQESTVGVELVATPSIVQLHVIAPLEFA